jgi:pimeloyl-ACP methyl ester carboxylesterase
MRPPASPFSWRSGNALRWGQDGAKYLKGSAGMRQKHFLGLGAQAFHRISYVEWGDSANPHTVVCVHGLTRNARDFDFLAASLAEDWRVACPDMAGRGDSDWLADKTAYNPVTYRNDCTGLIARLDVERVAWVGTSMGGIIGMSLAAVPGSPIERLVINDIGPFIPSAGLKRIAGSVGADPRFADLGAAETYLKEAMATFGIARAEHWRHLAEHGTRQAAGGGWRLHYDPGIAATFTGAILEDTEFWPLWEAIHCPVLVLRGAQSDILLAETAERMRQTGPRAEVVEVAGCGHAPALMEADQIAVVREWLGR